jgi:hypothetical protein
MPRITDIHSIIVPAQSANTSAHMYSEVYGGTGGCIININGVVLNVAESSNIPVWVKTVSGGTGCYLLGENQNVLQGTTGNMSSSGPYTGNTIG